MAVLYGKTNGIAMTVRPYRLSDEGQPSWILTQLELKQEGTVILTTTLSLTAEDLAELRTQLADLAAAGRVDFRLEITDGDLVFEGHRGDSPGDVVVGLWKGLPYEVMKGYRFLVKADDLPQFVADLLYDETVACPSGRLPE